MSGPSLLSAAGGPGALSHNAQLVRVLSPEGTSIATIPLGEANNQGARPTNVAFGGTERTTLFITATVPGRSKTAVRQTFSIVTALWRKLAMTVARLAGATIVMQRFR